jgi:hypothetical protein
MIFGAAKKGKTTNLFSPLSFVAVFGSGIRDPGSEIRDPGWTKISIRNTSKVPKILLGNKYALKL